MPSPLRDVPQEGIELIKSFEGIPDGDPSTVNIDAYLDPVGIWTIGWGHAITVGGSFLRGASNRDVARAMFPGGITLEQAEALLRGDLVDTASQVGSLVRVALDDGQYGALVSFAFNAGVGNLSRSTLLRLLNDGDYAGAAEQFLVWDKGRINGVLQPLAGLTRRRRAERALFKGEDWRAAGAAVRAVRSRAGPPTLVLVSAPPAPARRTAAQTRGSKRATKSAAADERTPLKRSGRTTTAKAPPRPAPAKRPPRRKAP